MARRQYGLPPLATLSAFEAAARHLSFKEAAAELNVTPGAVSHQVKALESELGVALFLRRHRRVDLTEEGRALQRCLASSFREIGDQLSALRRAAESRPVTIAATTAMAGFWLTPRLTAFWRRHGDVAVTQMVSDRPLLHGESYDLRIRYGRAAGEDLIQHELFRDELVALARPETAARLAGADLGELAAQPLIGLDAVYESWTTWKDWFRALGHDHEVRIGFRVNSYAIALQAARDGAGLVLGWRRLVAPLLSDGVLQPVGVHRLAAPQAFYIISDAQRSLSAEASLLRDWLTAGSSSESHSPETEFFPR